MANPIQITITEDLSSQVDGATTSFTTSKAFVAGSLEVSLNGKRQKPGGLFNETSSTTFSTTTTPEIGDELQVQFEFDIVGFDIVNASGIDPAFC